jgi:hypothetical protein
MKPSRPTLAGMLRTTFLNARTTGVDSPAG